MKAVVIIPTYNESNTIGHLIHELHKQFNAINHNMSILVVDDNSPDGTAGIVRHLQKRFPELHLLEGKKVGLGAAYIRGMTHAMQHMDADVVFEMDADFSHNPVDLPRLMEKIDKGADFVIGSRYVKGGSIPDNWGLFRRMNSQGGNYFARHIAGIHQIRDCTAGFRAIRTSALRKINLHSLVVQGYAFQLALLHAAITTGAKVEEIPVAFIDRTVGESKLGITDIIEFIRYALRLRQQGN